MPNPITIEYDNDHDIYQNTKKTQKFVYIFKKNKESLDGIKCQSGTIKL